MIARTAAILWPRSSASFEFEVETLSSGTEAIDRLQDGGEGKKPVELILMDWKMPEMNGLDTSRKIRQELQLNLPIIMMTAFAREVHKSEAEQAGTNGFLTKPIFQSTLFDAIMDAFGKEASRKSGAKADFTTKASMYKKHLKGCSILVAEDNYTNQLVARAILEGAGVLVKIVENGQEAVAAVQHEPFDAVLMDIQMPKMNGYEATRQIRTLPGCEELPIIAMTAHAMKGDEEKCLEAGMDGYVAKPINQDRFFYTLWRLLRNRKRVVRSKEAAHADAGIVNVIDRPWDVEKAAVVHQGNGQPKFGGEPLIPCQIPGVDVTAALRATGLDWRTYKEILVGFYQDNKNTVASIQEALAEKDLQSLLSYAHRIKGSAANIGARSVQQEADALEQECNGQGSIDAACELTTRLLVELENLFQVLCPLVVESKDQDSDAGAPAVDAEDNLEELLSALTEAIDRADPVEIHTINVETRRKLADRKMVDQSLLKLLDTQIRRYDYEEALKTIQQVRDVVEEHR